LLNNAQHLITRAKSNTVAYRALFALFTNTTLSSLEMVQFFGYPAAIFLVPAFASDLTKIIAK
jgi:hypothetical protein